jgi:hypothetical protein
LVDAQWIFPTTSEGKEAKRTGWGKGRVASDEAGDARICGEVDWLYKETKMHV